ncbi:MAG: methylated-DNA--[protein]-cysteine S-methyltransferase [Rhodospirillales bacterium]|jgi:methylated-DNA-[protein]-cysteine S-methyltransferase|nr:methylated-DNA--[protein]-cysteine S-methyltransferase [Rhodospirillales bacterium]
MAHVSLHSPFGSLTVFEEDGVLVALEWGWSPAAGVSSVLDRAIRQLEAYFDGALTGFELPLAAAATPFQARMRAAMVAIPYGETVSYGDLARWLGSAPRAVGRACARNPLPVIVPCHRVLAGGGRIGGYSGGVGIETKRALLRLEGCRGDREIVAS